MQFSTLPIYVLTWKSIFWMERGIDDEQQQQQSYQATGNRYERVREWGEDEIEEREMARVKLAKTLFSFEQ
jgi:hypothetical protein